ncbi:hypothetical protein [Mycobacterium sp.]|uniref:hypothetical protein n=1 Tax=Mycobacterium sp. TaxID=1785 RepID=UPI003C77BE55
MTSAKDTTAPDVRAGRAVVISGDSRGIGPAVVGDVCREEDAAPVPDLFLD